MAVVTEKREVPDEVYEDHDGWRLEIYREQDPIDPRNGNRFGTMLCSHERYRLGDEQIDTDRFDGWSDVRRHIKQERDAAVILPLYLVDHGVQRMKTEPFNNPWDSGQVGFIYATGEELSNSDRDGEEIRERLKSIVDEYDIYLTGDVWKYELYDETGGMLDSCGGFISLDYERIFNSAGLDRKDFEEKEVDA